MGRRSVWSKPELVELSESFVPIADETWRLQRGDDAECRYFQRIVADGGHYQRTGGTRQGIYVCAPSGTLLTSLNSLNAQKVGEALELGLERWRALPEQERYLPSGQSLEGSLRWEDSYPEDGLVLTSVRRDLPADDDPFKPRAPRWNRDPVWMSRDEARGWLPAELEVGSSRRVAAELVVRLARFHLVDNALGQSLPFTADEVEGSWIEARVERAEARGVRVALEGVSKAVSDGVWRLEDSDWSAAAKGNFPRSVHARIEGHFVYDPVAGVFLEFELIAVGERIGRTRVNGRTKDNLEGRIGFYFELAEGLGRVAPTFIGLYDVPWVERPAH